MGDEEVSSMFSVTKCTENHWKSNGKEDFEDDAKLTIDESEEVEMLKGEVSENHLKLTEKEGFEEKLPTDESEDVESLEDKMSDEYRDEKDSVIDMSDSEDTILSHSDKDNTSKRRKKALRPFVLHLKCEWRNCAFETDNDSKFHVHVSYHIPDLEIKTMGNGEEVYVCLWAECNYMTGGVSDIQRHVTYHSFHTKLKNIGEKIIEEWDLPKCTCGSETRNMIPEKLDPMVCEWKNCCKEFKNVQVFLHHTQMHVNDYYFELSAIKKKMKCEWNGCIQLPNLSTRVRLVDHIRSHTKEKVVACPTCGHMFATHSNLSDHCKRQLPNELSEFQCSHCYKHFASLRLLKDHMRGHVNFYKCCYCDMTCTSRHTYSAHIRYKHLDSKPFKCSMCKYSCKTQYDLKMHLTKHYSKNHFECEESNCDFSCRARQTLQKHMIEEHQIGVSPVYCCHMPDCKSQYKRGSYLTKHLMTKHCLRWPSGHSKFMYHRQEDGLYRLQTVRYESVKLYGENASSASPSKTNFKLSPMPVDGSKSFKVSPIEPDSSNGFSQVFISIEDESGNTINCCTATEVLGDRIPKNAMIIASADSITHDEDGNKSESTFEKDPLCDIETPCEEDDSS